MNKKDVKIIKEHILHEGFLTVKRYLLQHKLFDGSVSDVISRDLVVRPQAAAALPYDPILDKIVLIEQFRAGALDDPESPWLTEIVAGLMEPGESAEALIHREVKEEAGLTVLDMLPIFEYWASPGGSTEYISLFCVRVDASSAGGVYGLAHEHEDIRVWTVDAQEAFLQVTQGKIKNAICLTALLWFQLHHKEIRTKWLTREISP